MRDNNGHDPAAGRLRLERLARLADILGCSVEDFRSNDGGPANVSEMAELLRLWRALGEKDDRARVLELMRQLAAR